MELFLFPEMRDDEGDKRAEKTVEYPAGAEQYPELVRILDEIRKVGQDLKQTEDIWAKFVPAFDRAQKWFSRRSEEHVRLPKGLTWSKIKDWIIDHLNLGIGKRQFERRVRAYREPGKLPEKNAATAETKRNTTKVLACADAIVVAYRAGQDISELVEVYERARSGDGVPAQGPASTGSVVTTIKQDPATAVIKETAVATIGTATDAGSRPKPGNPSEPIFVAKQHSNALNPSKTAASAPERSQSKHPDGSSKEQRVRVVAFKKSAEVAAPELKPSLLHPFGDRCLQSLRGAETGDGAWEFTPDRLYELLDLDSPQRIFVSDTYDVFDERVPVDVIIEHLRVFAAVPWVYFSILTGYSSRLGQIQSALNSQRMSWPRNLEVGLAVNSTSNMERALKAFGLYRTERKWLCFLPFESREGHSLSRECPSLANILEQTGRPRIVIGGRIDRQSRRSSLCAADARFLMDAAKAAGSKVFYCPESAKLAFERGDSLAQIVNEINLDQQAVKGTFYGLDRSRELPDFRFAAVGKVQSFARSYGSVLRLKPVRHAYSRFELEFGTAAQWP